MKTSPTRGWTLVEALVTIFMLGVVFLFMHTIIRNFSRGVIHVERRLPLQHNLQVAKLSIEKDLTVAIRSTVGNVVPNPGFEDVPTRLTTAVPPLPGDWGYTPLLRRRAIDWDFTTSVITSSSSASHQGHYGLMVDSNDQWVAIYSSTFNLVAGEGYLFGGKLRRNLPSGGSPGDWNNQVQAALAWGTSPVDWPGPYPSGRYLLISTSSMNWTFKATTFTANNLSYNIQLGHIGNAPPRKVFLYDDIIVSRLAVSLTPTNGNTFEFTQFLDSADPAAQRVRHRYRMEPDGVSGRIVHERLTGTGWVFENSLSGIRRMLIGWDFGQAFPGQLPTPIPAEFFNNGLVFPVGVVLEAGPVGAPPDRSLTLQFSVLPEVP